MKRFFQPVPKDGSPAKKRPAADSGDAPAAAGGGGGGEGSPGEEPEPRKFLTWNANSLLLRMKSDWPAFSQFVARLDPDVICIQEVRMPAAGSKGAPKNPSELKDDTSSARGEKQYSKHKKYTELCKLLDYVLVFSIVGCIAYIGLREVVLQSLLDVTQVVLRALSSSPFKDYRVWWSLSDSKYAGTAMFIKKKFEPKKVSFNLDRSSSKHESDGRVIIAEFESFLLLNTYAPNNGWKEEENSFQRRRKWDKRILEFVQKVNKPLIWCGDLNVSHEEIDVSHPDFFSSAKLNGYIPPNKECLQIIGSNLLAAVPFVLVVSSVMGSMQLNNLSFALQFWDCGQPGFTPAERRRFGNILSQGKLVDAYRHLHKEKDMDCGFSWSGHPIGKYRGKRMRIDYFIISEKLKDRIISCEMHGRGIELEGDFMEVITALFHSSSPKRQPKKLQNPRGPANFGLALFNWSVIMAVIRVGD
ncbi:hypothetical protein ACP4OV_003428 [Aristida adscensionis]